MTARRYDIDWIRVAAIGLLLLYHTAIGFQPWGFFIGFITNNEFLQSLWTPMMMLNIWRIPILFYVSGMGLFLAMQHRNGKQLFTERFLRIGIPLAFGAIVIVPIHLFLLQKYYDQPISYTPSMGHLWFLGNILVYVVMTAPVIYFIKKRKQNAVILLVKKLFSIPFCFVVILAAFFLEALIMVPSIYEMYAYTAHGFFLGLIAFLSGYAFMMGGVPFWKMLQKWKWIFLLVALVLFLIRASRWFAPTSTFLLPIESNCWIFSLLALANRYMNKNSKLLSYLKDAAYPVYIMHMVFLYFGAAILFPLPIDASVKFVLLLIITLASSLLFYEFVIKRIPILRPIFGLKIKQS